MCQSPLAAVGVMTRVNKNVCEVVEHKSLGLGIYLGSPDPSLRNIKCIFL